MPAIDSCVPVEASVEKACELFSCGTMAGEKELLRAIGLVLCNSNTALSNLTEGDISLTVNAEDAGPAWVTSRGVAGARFTSNDQSAAVASITDAPTAGQKLVITDLWISSSTALRLDFNVEDSATVIETVYMAANQSIQMTLRGKWKLPTADKKLQVQSSVAGAFSITPYYYSEA